MQHFGDRQSIMEISIDSRGLTGFETESWSYLFLSVGVNPYILTLVCTMYVLNLPSLATLICETTVFKVLKALMTSNLTIGFFPLG